VRLAVDAARVQHDSAKSGSATFICNEPFTCHFAVKLLLHQHYYQGYMKEKIIWKMKCS